VDEVYAAFCFDRSVHRFGIHLDNKLEAVEGKDSNEIRQKRLRIMQQYIPRADGAPSTGQFSDPANRST
jgi:hypothetical protein